MFTYLTDHGLHHIVQKIFAHQDPESVTAAELVSSQWRDIVANTGVWKLQLESMVQTSRAWCWMSTVKGW